MNAKSGQFTILAIAAALTLQACSTNQLPPATVQNSLTTAVTDYKYLIGPNDTVTIFVWRNPELSGSFIVRPDGQITTSLVEDIPVAGKTPSQLAREMEKILAKFIRDPVVTVSVNGFVGPFSGKYFSGFFSSFSGDEIQIKSMLYVVILALFGTGIAKVLYTKLVQISTPVFASSVTYLMPLVAIFWGSLDGEKLSFLQLLAGLIIMLGVYLVNKAK